MKVHSSNRRSLIFIESLFLVYYDFLYLKLVLMLIQSFYDDIWIDLFNYLFQALINCIQYQYKHTLDHCTYIYWYVYHEINTIVISGIWYKYIVCLYVRKIFVENLFKDFGSDYLIKHTQLRPRLYAYFNIVVIYIAVLTLSLAVTQFVWLPGKELTNITF